MEGSDVFAQEIDGTDDPFAGTDLDFAEPPEARPEVPTVDREGNRIDGAPAAPAPAEAAQEAAPTSPTQESPQPSAGSQSAPDVSGGHPTMTEEQAAENAARYREERGEPDPQPAGPGTTDSDAGQPPTTPGAGEGTAELASDPTPPSSESSPATTVGDGSAPTSAAPAPTEPAAAEAPGSGQEPSAGSDEEEEAEPPAETKDKSGRVTKRRYLIFKVDGPGRLSEVRWYEDKQGKLTERGPGAKRQSVVLARGTDDALKFGFAAVGAPRNGVKLVAVAALHFQPKEVKPMPPEPTKQRLVIN